MRPNLEHATIERSHIKAGNKIGTLFQLLGATFAMDDDMPHILSLDPGGSAREVRLPPEAKGLWYIIANTADAAELLTVKEDAGSVTIATLGQDEVGLFFCSTNEAGALEWRALTPSGVGDTLTTGTLNVTSSAQLGDAAADTLGFYGATVTTQRASSNQITTNIAVSASFGASQLAVIQEIMNTLTGLGLWKGAA